MGFWAKPRSSIIMRDPTYFALPRVWFVQINSSHSLFTGYPTPSSLDSRQKTVRCPDMPTFFASEHVPESSVNSGVRVPSKSRLFNDATLTSDKFVISATNWAVMRWHFLLCGTAYHISLTLTCSNSVMYVMPKVISHLADAV